MHKTKPTRRILKNVAQVLGCDNGGRGSLAKKLMSRDGVDSKTLDGVASLLEVSFEQYLSDVRPYLTTVQVAALVHDGFHIGGHSINHLHYGTLTASEQISQTIDSTHLVRQRFGLDYSVFAFPYSDSGIRASFFKKLEGHIDLFFGTSAFCRDRANNIFQRFWMEDTLAPAAKILNRLYVRHEIRALIGLNEAKR
jgi:peptidoglycan/xylan/chitin deacetylase (PgdA/CDA1 family)